jgi:DNA polymerase-3 subunit delta'
MNKPVWKNLVGQERIKEALGSACVRGTLGHAYLLCGEEGAGTFQAALELAMALLCRSSDAAPCYACEACRKVLHYAHTDLNIVVPLTLGKEHRGSEGLSDDGWAYVGEVVRAKIQEPYLPPVYDGIPTMPVDWIRDVMHAVQRGSLTGHTNVAILCGVEHMNKESANAMLKTLEEPPAGSLLLLCTEAPHNVLPTIQSRCQVLRFGRLSDDDITVGLRARVDGELSPQALSFALESCQGSLGTALALAAAPSPEAMLRARRLWDLAGERDLLTRAAGIDALAGELDIGSAEKLLIYCIHIVRNSLLGRIAGGAAYVPSATPLVTEAPTLDPRRAASLTAVCQDALAGVRARGNLSLLLVNFVLELAEILHEQEQQPG